MRVNLNADPAAFSLSLGAEDLRRNLTIEIGFGRHPFRYDSDLLADAGHDAKLFCVMKLESNAQVCSDPFPFSEDRTGLN